jgi:hypothetical protein
MYLAVPPQMEALARQLLADTRGPRRACNTAAPAPADGPDCAGLATAPAAGVAAGTAAAATAVLPAAGPDAPPAPPPAPVARGRSRRAGPLPVACLLTSLRDGLVLGLPWASSAAAAAVVELHAGQLAVLTKTLPWAGVSVAGRSLLAARARTLGHRVAQRISCARCACGTWARTA